MKKEKRHKRKTNVLEYKTRFLFGMARKARGAFFWPSDQKNAQSGLARDRHTQEEMCSIMKTATLDVAVGPATFSALRWANNPWQYLLATNKIVRNSLLAPSITHFLYLIVSWHVATHLIKWLAFHPCGSHPRNWPFVHWHVVRTMNRATPNFFHRSKKEKKYIYMAKCGGRNRRNVSSSAS